MTPETNSQNFPTASSPSPGAPGSNQSSNRAAGITTDRARGGMRQSSAGQADTRRESGAGAGYTASFGWRCWCTAATAAGHWAGDRRGAFARGVLPQLRQSKGGGRVCRVGAKPMEDRRDGCGGRHFEGRQRPRAQNAHTNAPPHQIHPGIGQQSVQYRPLLGGRAEIQFDQPHGFYDRKRMACTVLR